MASKKLSNHAQPALHWSPEAIRAQLDRILGHAEFHATKKMQDFLRFVVEETLAGRSEQIKGFTIATEVYGRDSDFDAAHDPVVRIQAGRLRRAMERYYLVAGRQDPIRIEIPKGGYVPTFTAPPSSAADSIGTVAPSRAKRSTALWPSVLLMPFEDMTGNPDLAFLGIGLTTELCIELGHCDDLRVMLFRDDALGVPEMKAQVDFMVSGSVRSDEGIVKIVIQLIDGTTGEQVWVDSFKSPLESGNLIAFQEKAANSISAHIAGEHGIIARTMTLQSGSRPLEELTTYQAILKGYTYLQTLDASSYLQAYEALQQARTREPDCGLVCSMLALMYYDNFSLEFFDLDLTPLDEAIHLAREGAVSLPDSQFSRLALARGLFLKNDLDAARSEVDAALALHPESLAFMDAIGYLLLLLGDWDRGERLVRDSMRLNPFSRVYARYGLWLNAIRQKAYARALRETEWIADLGVFWGPLARAATLGLLRRPAEGHEAVRQLLAIKPDFPERAQLLIGHYVKSPEIVEQLLEGLARAGLTLDRDPLSTPETARMAAHKPTVVYKTLP